MTVFLRVPVDRLGVIIGPGGEMRRQLEEKSGIQIEVDSEHNEVALHDEAPGTDPVMLLKLRDVVRALARGFSPEHAMRLFSDEFYFEMVDIHDYVGKRKGHVRRLTSRIVGTEGRTRRIIEEMTGCHLAIYGHTVGIVGDLEGLTSAREAVDMVLQGSEHATVYRFLENQRRRQRSKEFGIS
ncbi:MAG TPA: KH domain-containing protein [Candidatus Thermoplasmatota archaeon]|nr:KH domain-containing protein [Candidatus Thermoplasmatota archaeon]